MNLESPVVLALLFITGATPKGVLKLMKAEGLTIYHVKSHLQVCTLYDHVLDPGLSQYELIILC